MRIEEMQFGGMLTMALLTLTLSFLLPMRTALGTIFSRARWLMAGATSLLFTQFLLQYTMHFRAMGVTQGVFINLLFFVPCAWQITLGVLYLQRSGKIQLHEWMTGIIGYLIMVAVLVIGGLSKGHSLLDDTPEMRTSEYISACIYSIMQLYFCWLTFREFRRLHRALNNFYDQDKSEVLKWMERSVTLLSLSGLFVPFTIFISGLPLLCYSLFIFLSIYYCIFSFICYGVSNAPQQIKEAEDFEELYEEQEGRENIISKEEKMHMDVLVSEWISNGGHLKRGITIQTAATDMNVSRHHFSLWLKTTEQELFNPWLTHLRIEEAKRLLKEHPNWSNENIAQSCGFNSRSYFQNVFRKEVGITPTQFIDASKKK